MNKKETRREFLKKSAGITAGFAIGVGYGCTGGGGQCGVGYGCAGDGPGSLGLPRYDTSKIKYLGKFDLPSGGGTINGEKHTGFQYPNMGMGGIAYNAANNSLFVCGSTINNDRRNTVLTEVSIPTPKTSGPYNEASIIQDYVLACGTKGRQIEVNTSELGNGCNVTGLLVHNGRLIITVAGLYVSSRTELSTFVREILDLSSGSVLGPYKVTDINQRIIGNGMGCELPENWQAVFGGYKALMGGGGNLSTMNNACYGPGFHLFNPDDVDGDTAETIDGVNLCYYTPIKTAETTAKGWIWKEPYSPEMDTSHVWTGMSVHRGTIVLPESRTFLAYGPGGSGAFYDTGSVITGTGQGTKAIGGTMRDRFWLYDANDLKAVFDGNESPKNNVFPYATFDMDFCELNHGVEWHGESNTIRALGFDPVNRKGYIHERKIGIHVLSFGV